MIGENQRFGFYCGSWYKLPFWLYFVNTSDKKFFSWMIACLCQAMSLDQNDETIYADFNADVYNDLIEYQFSNIVKLMSGLELPSGTVYLWQWVTEQ
jgi:hypothetical protein